jgi:hypothetical protein
MPVTQSKLERAIVRSGNRSSYLILNQSVRDYIFTKGGTKIGILSSTPVPENNPPWEENPQGWMFWQPKGARAAVYVERAFVEAYVNLSNNYACQVNWLPEAEIENIASFRVYPMHPSKLFGETPEAF